MNKRKLWKLIAAPGLAVTSLLLVFLLLGQITVGAAPGEHVTIAEARLLLAVKLYELGRVSTGTAAQLAGMNRVAFMFALSRFGLSPIGLEPGELAEDLANA
jgi:predicted HTH domain antitoxin